jgi:hypothetical protein
LLELVALPVLRAITVEMTTAGDMVVPEVMRVQSPLTQCMVTPQMVVVAQARIGSLVLALPVEVEVEVATVKPAAVELAHVLLPVLLGPQYRGMVAVARMRTVATVATVAEGTAAVALAVAAVVEMIIPIADWAAAGEVAVYPMKVGP